MTKIQANKIKELLPLVQAIKDKCLDCSAGSFNEVKHCVCTGCVLYPYRTGLKSKHQDFTREKSQDTAENTSDNQDETNKT